MEKKASGGAFFFYGEILDPRIPRLTSFMVSVTIIGEKAARSRLMRSKSLMIGTLFAVPKKKRAMKALAFPEGKRYAFIFYGGKQVCTGKDGEI